MKPLQVFRENQHIGEIDDFPWNSMPTDDLIYDRRDKSWYTMDMCPLHIDSVPKETRFMLLLLALA